MLVQLAYARIDGITTTHQEYLMKEMKDMILRQNEAVFRQEIARADGQQTAIESSLQQLSVGGGTQLSEESEQSRQELLQEIRQQQASSDTLRKMCEEALKNRLRVYRAED
jgi:hypothetical protein